MRTIRATRRGLSLLAVAALLAGCGGAEAGDPADTASPVATASDSPGTATATPSSELTASTPAASPTSTSAATAAGCDPSGSDLPTEVPNGAERVAEATGDLDGDGLPDRLVTWALTLEEDQVVHRLRVVTGSGFVAEADLDQADTMADVRPLGAVPVGDGLAGALVVEAAGASSVQVSLWGLHVVDGTACELGRLTVADDSYPVTFPVGATTATKAGLWCHEVDGTPDRDRADRHHRPRGRGPVRLAECRPGVVRCRGPADGRPRHRHRARRRGGGLRDPCLPRHHPRVSRGRAHWATPRACAVSAR